MVAVIGNLAAAVPHYWFMSALPVADGRYAYRSIKNSEECMSSEAFEPMLQIAAGMMNITSVA